MNPVCVSTWHGSGAKYFSSFQKTAERHGICPINADDSKWEDHQDWRKIPWHKKTDGYLNFARQHQSEFSHMMFVDAYDVIFAAGWDEIMGKFLKFGVPIVLGTECYCWPNLELAGQYPKTPHRCKYLNAGFWMAESGQAVGFLEECVRRRVPGQDDQSLMVDIFLHANRGNMKLDTSCSLLFCCNMNSLEFIEMKEGRPTCKDTGEKPCIFHGNGASPVDVVAKMME